MHFKVVTSVTAITITLTPDEVFALREALALLRDRYDQDHTWPNDVARRFFRDLNSISQPFPKP